MARSLRLFQFPAVIRLSAVMMMTLFSLVAVQAQEAVVPGDSSLPIPTIRVETRLVVTNVIVTDRNQQPVQGLQPSDFTIEEGDVPQKIKNFEEYSSASRHANQPAPALPPGTFTNYRPYAPGPLNVFLFDLLNTPAKDISNSRDQILAYLDHATPGTRIAIFVLDDRLDMIQGFTDNFDEVRSVLKHYKPRISIFTPSEFQGAMPVGVGGLTEGAMMGAAHGYSIATLNGLARYLSGVPGRKNLIWFSAALGLLPVDSGPERRAAYAAEGCLAGPGSFTSALTPQGMVLNDDQPRVVLDADGGAFPGSGATSIVLPPPPVLGEEQHQTATLFALGQVAIYPIDPRGPIDKDRPCFKRNVYLKNVAASTGGRAFTETTDIQGAISNAIEDGSNYYSLSYTPSDATLDHSYRTIKVLPRNPEYTLSYRDGYYADDVNSNPFTNAKNAKKAAASTTSSYSRMRLALLRGTPQLSQVLFTARVQPGGVSKTGAVAAGNDANKSLKGPLQRYRIDIVADLRTIAFSPAGGEYTSSLESGAYLYDKEKLVNSSFAKGGIKRKEDPRKSSKPIYGEYQHEISVPAKGDYFLRIALHDLKGDGIGAIEIPISEVRNVAAAGN